MAQSGPAGRELEKKYLEFSLLLSFCLLPVSPNGQAQPKADRKSLVIEPKEIIL